MKKPHLAVAFILLAAGCGGGGTSTTQNPPPPPSDPDQHADYLIAQMTQSEKLQLVAGAGTPQSDPNWWILNFPRGAGGYFPGIPRLGIPALYYTDGSLGLADASCPATALPSSIASTASWDLNEAYKFGTVIGKDMRSCGVNVNLGGNINLIGREPRDGRTFETKGEDPILAGKIAAAHIKGVQDQHIIGGTKHFALNDQETGRTFANVIVDERSARETDLLAFEIAIKDSNVQSVMCSYNLIQWGTAGSSAYSCENSHLLNDILKHDWAFPGFVMSDWWATHSSYQAAIAGLDQEQPDPGFFAAGYQGSLSLAQAIQSGQMPQSRLDNMVHRILRAMLVSGLFDYPSAPGAYDVAGNEAIAQEAEEQGAVLLKTGVLPLDPSATMKIAVIGMHADIAVLSGGGSAQVYPTGGAALNEGEPSVPGWSQVIWDPSSPLNAIKAKAPNATVQFDPGTDATSAANLAAASDVAIVFVSQWASEGMDLPALNFTDVIHTPPADQDAMVAAVAAVKPTIVVLENGGPQAMPWLDNVNAVLEAWYPGQKGADAIANILFGTVNPSGKLPVTFPASVNDLPRPIIPGVPNTTTQFNVDYTIEGLNVGYKWFDTKSITPLFPFGFGLSYTTFSITNPQLTPNASPQSGFQVSCDVKNTGTRAGAEVVQVYLALPASTGEPPKRLVGWSKTSTSPLLQPGATQHVTITVDANDSSHPLSYWGAANGWTVANGDYTVFVGNSSASSALTAAGTFHVGP